MSSAPNETPAGGASRSRRRFTVDALFVDHRPQAVGVADLATAKEIRLDRIVRDPAQPRHSFDPDKLEELTESIRLEGVLQPISVRYDGERDVYVVVHGERRWRAAQAAGLTAIPAIVREVPEERRLIQQLMENVVREDLNAVDRAAALRALKGQLGDAPWEAVAEAVGIKRSRLFQLLGTEKLPEAAREDIRAGRLSEKQSRALQGLPPAEQEALRVAIVKEELPAEEALRRARTLRVAAGGDGARPVVTLPEQERWEDVPSTSPQGSAEDATAALLAAIAAAATGGRTERSDLARAAVDAAAPAYDADRLRGEVLALARSLARAPAAALQPGGDAYPVLAALWGALDAILGAER